MMIYPDKIWLGRKVLPNGTVTIDDEWDHARVSEDDMAYVRADLYGDLVQDIGEKHDALEVATQRIRELEDELAGFMATFKGQYITELEKQDLLQKKRIRQLEAENERLINDLTVVSVKLSGVECHE